MSESISEFTSSGFGNLNLYGLGEPTGFHEPSAVLAIPYSPQTVGWVIVLLAVCLYGCMRIYFVILYWLDNRYRKEYLSQLPNPASDTFERDSFQIMTKVRAISNASNPEYKAHLFGCEWLKTMDKQCLEQSSFASELGLEWMKVLTNQRKDAMTLREKKRLLACCEYWILNHRNKETKSDKLKTGGRRGA